ncbi:glycosyltransferase family 2 protein [Leptospira bandrabouensis]|uniref:Glycosyltransferase family 2 protein n=1 Tax=Leptospira bandrabouensis TaxID=2484903 RepID=A0A6H3NPP8_9LEPT|nr:glycosyltransferase family 2 protein [Leptospira bandrabouensis]MCG6144912.1 glycosyltransferase family 2 protein [Leptospira bandrabouensis]MCG6152927.1 glycosyltransferase family 2 protein [Leptospira bandrabouensis]MCG6160451.1 glycosyltransferase family 2 protein [Leptospira bandrabouensis]MCG6164383.1 glycosyltransferase family 2 protein [Leptospira bandrabouensis]MCW7460378.1 glycosyltransferase family 2 protein [Leptospira bandrabouensis]
MKLVSSIVLYRNPKDVVIKAIDSFLENQPNRRMVLVDHSPEPTLSNLASNSQITYYHNPSNPGFGAGHNLAHSEIIDSNKDKNEKYIIIQNPDVFIDPGCINTLIQKLEANPKIGLITCRVLNPDGSIQKLLKKDPNLFALITRRIPFLKNIPIFNKALQNFLVSDDLYLREVEIPIVSGCFFIIPRIVWNEIGGFDERYFLYFEDFDICRKVRAIGKQIVYSPEAEITHLWTRGAHTSFKHLLYFAKSMIQYFNKWGWKIW